MNTERAQEISTSPNMANVTYNGEQIYIEHVDQSNQMATIHPLDQPQNKQSVSVQNLIEHS